MRVLIISKSFLTIMLGLWAIGLFGCYPELKEQARQPEEALREVRFFFPSFQDDLSFDSLSLAIERNLEYLYRLDPDKTFFYGPHSYTCRQVRETQEFFLSLIKAQLDPDELRKSIKTHFRVYKATGRPGNRKVLFTGYYEPVFEGSLKPDEIYRYPIYRKPDDLLEIDLSLFSKKYDGERIVARIEGKEVLPYFSRYDIDIDEALVGRNLEIAWLKDPLDAALLQIQGSGRIRLPDDTMIPVGYHASNGRPYRSIGGYLIEKGLVSREEMSMQAIRRYLSENPDKMDEVLNHNPSYVFFHILEEGPLGNISVPLTPGRSVALDARLFPKGALAFISCQKPTVRPEGEIIGWRPFSRFVLNQDTGGAIKGAGRADLFWGRGRYAEVAAGHMKHDGELYILIKKP